jgi:uncharacterized protein (TIGR02391 family)
VDEDWADGVLTWWVETAEAALSEGGGQRYAFASVVGVKVTLLRAKEDQTRRVVARIMGLPKLPVLMNLLQSGKYVELQSGIETARYALGRLRTEAETKAMLGTTAPTMTADALHPLIWGAASKRWESGHYSDAVQRAATALSGFIKDQTGRYELGDNDLMTQAFSPNAPQESKPRLRWPGNDDDLTVKAMRQGILNMSQGVFSAIRNPVTHTTDELPKQEALEQLATLSILARWIERCELIAV